MMFFKLLKHDIKSTGRWYLLLFIASIIGSIVISLTLTDIQPTEVNDFNLWYFLLYTTVTIIFIAMFVYSGITIGIYFYKNMFGKEGYLTLTLPLSIPTLILSKVISAIILTFVTFAVFLLDIFIITYPHIDSFNLNMDVFYNILTDTDFISGIIYFFILIVNGALSCYMCISIGQLFTNHRVLMIFVTMFIIGMIQSIIDAILNINMTYNIIPESIIHTFSIQNLWWSVAEYIVLSIIYYGVTHYIIARRLNIQ